MRLLHLTSQWSWWSAFFLVSPAFCFEVFSLGASTVSLLLAHPTITLAMVFQPLQLAPLRSATEASSREAWPWSSHQWPRRGHRQLNLHRQNKWKLWNHRCPFQHAVFGIPFDVLILMFILDFFPAAYFLLDADQLHEAGSLSRCLLRISKLNPTKQKV